jgi:AcrR family transcriptional regulator
MENTREALLQHAKRVFYEKGYDGATVKDLADAAGVNVSLVSYYFGGKEGLYRECLTRFGQERFEFAERMLSSVDEASLTPEDFKLRLTLFLSEFIEAQMREPEVAGILHREITNPNSDLLQGFGNIFIRHFEAIVRFVLLAQKKGIVRKDLEPQIASALLISGLVHLMRMEPLAKKLYQRSFFDPAQRGELARTAVSFFLDGVIQRHAPSETLGSLPSRKKTTAVKKPSPQKKRKNS